MEKHYDDIINLPHFRSKKHPPMPIGERAAQFAPFAALKGYEERLEEIAKESENDETRSPND